MRVSMRKSARNGHDIAANMLKIKHALSDSVETAKDRAGEMLLDSVDEIKDKSARAQEKVATYTARRPFKTIGIALLTGVVIGYLLKK